MAPKRLNQLLSIEKNFKSKRESEVTEAYQNLQKVELQNGLTKSYTALEEAGVKLPSETKRVQVNPEEVLLQLRKPMAELMDLVAQRDATNGLAKADIVVDGAVLLKDVPAVTCLFLERKLSDMAAVLKATATLSLDEDWKRDDLKKLWVTEPIETNKTKKITEYMRVVEATKEHPAQVKEVTKDVVEGTWKTVKMSSSLPKDKIKALVERVEVLQKAVKSARQEANSQNLVDLKVGDPLLNYIFTS